MPSGGGKLKVRCKHCGFVIDVNTEPSGQSQAGAVKWFVAVGNERRGPMPAEGVLSLIKAAEIGAETFAWRKGFKEWTRLGDLPEFQAELAPTTEDVEETQLMDLKDIQRVTGAQAAVTPEISPEAAPTRDEADSDPGFDTAADASAPTAEEESQSGMVWQRRETSVLFSLDDYKTRKKTKQTGALTASSQLEMKPIDDEGGAKEAPKGTRTTGVISLDESQVKLMADKMSKRARRRQAIVGSVAGFVILVVLAMGGYWFMTRPPAPESKPAPKAAVAEKKAAAEVAPAPVPEKKPEPTPVAEKPPAPAAEDAPTAKKAPASDGKREVAPKKPSKKAPRKAKSAAKKTPKKVVAKAEKSPKPTPAPSPKATDDVNALLAQYKAGKQGGKPGAGGGSPKSEASDGSNLPTQLTMGQIQSVLRKKTRGVKKCVRAAGAPKGTMVKAKTRIVISGSGRVVSATVSNAAGAEGCIRAMLTKLKFPRFKGANMVVPYPFAVVP